MSQSPKCQAQILHFGRIFVPALQALILSFPAPHNSVHQLSFGSAFSQQHPQDFDAQAYPLGHPMHFFPLFPDLQMLHIATPTIAAMITITTTSTTLIPTHLPLNAYSALTFLPELTHRYTKTKANAATNSPPPIAAPTFSAAGSVISVPTV